MTRLPLLMTVIAAHVVAALAVRSSLPWLYTAAISIFYASLPVIGTIQFAAVTRMPNADRAAVLCSVAQTSGLALGPLVGAALVEQVGYEAVPWLDVTCILLAGGALLPLLRRPAQPRGAIALVARPDR